MSAKKLRCGLPYAGARLTRERRAARWLASRHDGVRKRRQKAFAATRTSWMSTSDRLHGPRKRWRLTSCG